MLWFTQHSSPEPVIVALTESGDTARRISRYRPTQPLVCFTPNETVIRQLSLSYGCFVRKSPRFGSLDAVLKQVHVILKRDSFACAGDSCVLAAGIPFGKSGGTNTLFVQKVA